MIMVYKHYSQQELNDQYNNRLHVPDYAGYFVRWDNLSRQTETEYDVIKNISFGIHPRECLDIFPSKKPLAKTMIFGHGGHLLDKTMFHFIAATFLKRDVTTVFINYPLAPAASMNTIVLSCRNAFRWVHDNILRFNGGASQIYVMGHSSGGHLASMVAIGENINFLKGVISLSGLFRLEPLMLSNLNDVLGMNRETARENNPVFLKPHNFCPFLLATGTDETDEFKSQSMDMYNAWKNKNSGLKLLKIKDKNHYSILDVATEKGTPLQSAIFDLMDI